MGILLAPRSQEQQHNWKDPETGQLYDLLKFGSDTFPSTPHDFQWYPDRTDKDALASDLGLEPAE